MKYPNVKIKLTGTDGNAFSVLGKCSAAAKKAGLTGEQVKEFQTEAMSGDYNHLLATCMNYFDVR